MEEVAPHLKYRRVGGALPALLAGGGGCRCIAVAGGRLVCEPASSLLSPSLVRVFFSYAATFSLNPSPSPFLSPSRSLPSTMSLSRSLLLSLSLP